MKDVVPILTCVTFILRPRLLITAQNLNKSPTDHSLNTSSVLPLNLSTTLFPQCVRQTFMLPKPQYTVYIAHRNPEPTLFKHVHFEHNHDVVLFLNLGRQ